jgi:tetratricopeptide (TPR) repeat protein
MWAAQTDRPNFALPVRIEECKLPSLLASIKHCDLFGNDEGTARKLLIDFLKPAGRPVLQASFPGTAKPAADIPKSQVSFPGGPRAISNIPIAVPRHFLGRDDVLAEIKTALAVDQGRVAITALYGLRGVGKTTLAAAYAERHRADYRATWWIRAETEATLRADLASLGVRLGWVAADEKEEPALAAAMQRLRYEGDGVLLVYDNANNAGEIRRYLPRGGAARVIVTSNAPNWSGIAAPVPIRVWPPQTGADYLIAQAGRAGERDAALALSEALGGLPLAHEQAAAYCDRLGISLAEYLKRFQGTPVELLDTEKDAAAEYHDRITVAKTFALAIDEAAKRHPAAEPLIVYAALLAPEPIPLYLFAEATGEFGQSFAAAIAGDGLDEAVAALRGFALIDREPIPDERDPTITTDCIRLHRLVRQVASARRDGELLESERRRLIEALATVYPAEVFRDPKTWPRARRLDALAMALVSTEGELPGGGEAPASLLLDRLASYRQGALAAYASARPLFERALAIDEKALSPDDRNIAASLNNLGHLLRFQDDLAGARSYYQRALPIYETALGLDHPDTASCLDNLGGLLLAQGELVGARPYVERGLAIREKACGPDHPETAYSLINLGHLVQKQGDLAGARPHYERALEIHEKALGPDHPATASSLSYLGSLFHAQDDIARALPLFERALAIYEKAVGPQHPSTRLATAWVVSMLTALGRAEEAKSLREKFNITE